MNAYFLLPLLALSLTATGAPLPGESSLAQGQAAPGAFGAAPCETGIFRQDQTAFVALTKGGKGYSYTFSDGTVGNTQDAGALLVCGKDAVMVRATQRWPKVALAESDTRFASGGVMLAGRLIEAPGADQHTPLVVYAHGSEGTGWIDRARDPYQMVGRGVSVFVYDKRGSGLSEGEYTQNFPRLADDLVAASHEARRLAQGRYGRLGLVGVSQGGWIVPLAQARAKADFIGVGYGLAVDIAQQDAAQVEMELRDRGYGEDIIDKARSATDITARLVKSAYHDGLDELAAFQQQFAREPWFSLIKGGYTGVLLGMPVEELRKHGVPRFDQLGVDWSQEPMQVLSHVTVPQLWALAEDDRQAPPAITVARLAALRGKGQAISVYLFPQADHGMRSYEQAPDGTRKPTVITPGYYDLMADWARGRVEGHYGQAYLK